jgi:tetratricopeptide (TPR) repeat protein
VTDDKDLPELQRARALWVANRFDEAVRLFVQTADQHRQNVLAAVDTARALGHRHEIQRAESYLARLQEMAGSRPDLLFLMGQTYRMIFREERAIRCFEAYVSATGQRHADAHFELAVLYERRHRVAEAQAAIERVLALDAAYHEAWILQARLLRQSGRVDEATRWLQRLTRQPRAHAFARAQAWAALADIADKSGDFALAVSHMGRCKELQLAEAALPRRHSAAVLGWLRAFNESVNGDDLRRWQTAPPPSAPARLAQLTSFPRSGTTLLESILDAHPGIVSSEEREVFGRDILGASWKESHEDIPPTVAAFDAIPAAKLAMLRQRYLRAMEEALDEPLTDRLHIDKNPTHTLFIPAIVRLFPETQFLVALRDPRDVVVSCYLQYLPLNPNSVCFLSWEATARRFALDMGTWLRLRSFLDRASWLEVRYEDVVADLPAAARRALAFLRLPWHDAVLGYRERLAARTVHTPTYLDVVQPIHRRTIGRWKNYTRWLAPCLPTLDPLVKALGYS